MHKYKSKKESKKKSKRKSKNQKRINKFKNKPYFHIDPPKLNKIILNHK